MKTKKKGGKIALNFARSTWHIFPFIPGYNHTHTHTHNANSLIYYPVTLANLWPTPTAFPPPPAPHTHFEIARLLCFAFVCFWYFPAPQSPHPRALFEMGQRAFHTTLCKLRLRVDICVSAIAHICSRPVSRARVLLPLLANYNRRIWLLSIAESFCLINGQRLRTFNVFTLAIDSQPQTGRQGGRGGGCWCFFFFFFFSSCPLHACALAKTLPV